jgi:hypothetical protein
VFTDQVLATKLIPLCGLRDLCAMLPSSPCFSP